MKKKLLILGLFLLSLAFGIGMAVDFKFTAEAFEAFGVVTCIIMTVLPFLILWAIADTIMDRKDFMKDVRAFKKYRFFLSDLVSKDIKVKYRRSALGVVWSVLNPLLMMCVLTAIFSRVFRIGAEGYGYIGGYALFYLTGYLMFNFISESSNFCLTSILQSAGLIRKVYIPKYLFPLEKCCFAFVNMCFSFIAFVIVFVFYLFKDFILKGTFPEASQLLVMPLAILPMIYVFIFALGVGLLVAAATVFFRDMLHLWSVFLTLWMYASPIIYPLETLPAWLCDILRVNPLVYYIDYFRCVLIKGALPTLEQNVMCLLFSFGALALGLLAFRKRQDKFILHV